MTQQERDHSNAPVSFVTRQVQQPRAAPGRPLPSPRVVLGLPDQRQRLVPTNATRVRIGGSAEPSAGEDAATIGASLIALVDDLRRALSSHAYP
jgi:hypothetical protein